MPNTKLRNFLSFLLLFIFIFQTACTSIKNLNKYPSCFEVIDITKECIVKAEIGLQEYPFRIRVARKTTKTDLKSFKEVIESLLGSRASWVVKGAFNHGVNLITLTESEDQHWGYYDHKNRGLILTKRFFNDFGKFTTQIANSGEETIIHELFHAFDWIYMDKTGMLLSSTDKFLQAVGWLKVSLKTSSLKNDTQWKLKDLNHKQFKTDWIEMAALSNSSSDEDLSRSIKLNMERAHKYGFPTLYSMTSPLESFADLGTFYALDPKYPSYVSPEVVKLFDELKENYKSESK